MNHQMGLYRAYFDAIRKGKKKVEVRLYDEKRRKIKVGDTIEFVEVPAGQENLFVTVEELTVYSSFLAMYEQIAFGDFDCEGWTMREMLEGTYEIYTPEQEKKWGALAIRIQ